MSLAIAWGLALALALPVRIAVPAAEPASRARYVASRADSQRGFALPGHESFGWSQRARLLPDGSTEITVVSQLRGATPRHAPSEPSAEALATLADASMLSREVRMLAEEIVIEARDDWSRSARLLSWVSLNIRHLDDPGHGESSTETMQHRSASCVGRSVLAVELLRASGIPARTLHGLLAEPRGDAPFLLHRFVETWIDGIGWVPSDPGESIHGVDARHVFIAVENGTYDPESQRSLRLHVAEPVASPVASHAPAGLRPLIVAERPRWLELVASQRGSNAPWDTEGVKQDARGVAAWREVAPQDRAAPSKAGTPAAAPRSRRNP